MFSLYNNIWPWSPLLLRMATRFWELVILCPSAHHFDLMLWRLSRNTAPKRKISLQGLDSQKNEAGTFSFWYPEQWIFPCYIKRVILLHSIYGCWFSLIFIRNIVCRSFILFHVSNFTNSFPVFLKKFKLSSLLFSSKIRNSTIFFLRIQPF